MARRMSDIKPAVFARNHGNYLEEAAQLSPTQLVTFRSATHWTAAATALEVHNTIPVYFAVVGEGPHVAFMADLVAVHLNPYSMDPDTERFLRFSLPSTVKEGLWESYQSSVRSLYMVKRCRKLDSTFPMTELIKVSNDEPIAPNYGYSYSVVYERGHEPDVITLLPGEVENPGQYWEGATRQVSVTTYERSSAAREACLRHYGRDCRICGFNFGSRYGELGEGFIHVHHLVPLSDLDEAYVVDPIKDLIPLCPNCHAMIHIESPSLDVEIVRAMLRMRANTSLKLTGGAAP